MKRRIRPATLRAGSETTRSLTVIRDITAGDGVQRCKESMASVLLVGTGRPLTKRGVLISLRRPYAFSVVEQPFSKPLLLTVRVVAENITPDVVRAKGALRTDGI